ncbi:hypothetical protein H0H87_006176 [Tephrocybe sp. NHM501043]|nr:hypothetical protein H0H87_006176 [Tephrocybe sp. NHM501043]
MSNFENLPLSTLLKECTREAHERIGSSPGAVALVRGGLQKKEYIKYLMVLWHVYDALETSLEQHATHPAIAPTYKPELFGRRSRLVADISFFLDVPEDTWKKHPMHVSLMKDMPKALTTYVARIRELAAAPDPSQLLAHAYIRYMGDLSGGQMIRHGIGKAYDLDETSGKGLSFCAFQELDSDKPASKEEILRIKDWFREGMDRSGEQGEELKGKIELILYLKPAKQDRV